MRKGPTITAKVWFAKGFHEYLSDSMEELPSALFVEHMIETIGVDVVKEYNDGVEAAKKGMGQ